MTLFAWILALTPIDAPPPAPPCAGDRMSAIVAEVKSADYRGDRAALERLDAILDEVDGGGFGEYREYWKGFARWRRALNGFNETPAPSDLADDLEKAIAHFRKSLDLRPNWIEARIGIVGCGASLLYLAGGDEVKKQALRKEFVPMLQSVQKDGAENPRALWLIGGMQFGSPPPYGGDLARATATLTHGLAAAWNESTARPASSPWVPAWGGAENLMNLAYIWSHSAAPNKSQALAYAQGAITAAPDWHYVKDILLPQIQKLPETVR
ncbi:MAG TPA: hypothetical protein VJA66_06645 [Thermoanaerobaculia bacterium]